MVALDLLGVVAVWTITVISIMPAASSMRRNLLIGATFVVAVSAVTMAFLASERLYLARVCAVRAVEMSRLLRSAAISAFAAVLFGSALGVDVTALLAIVAAVALFAVLTLLRSGYAVWLRRCRARGRFCRDVVIVGTNEEAADLCQLLETQPELGYRVRGFVGPGDEWALLGTEVPWLGPTRNACNIARDLDAGAMIAVTGLPAPEMKRVTRDLLARGVHVQISTGLARISQQRFRALPISHVPLFYIERPTLAGWQRNLKRLIDVSLASLVLVLSTPFLAIAAIATKLEDRGAVLFRQERVGLDGKRFTLLKLRTMVSDASSQLALVKAYNEREDGPLFKMTDDPRVTRVGRLLRATSIDELPQLVNVIRGEMSLVGPRPALPDEVAEFDNEHLTRLGLRPGVTGLWQVEARHNPSFQIYRRLDLFYAENWSARMDATILMRTLATVVGQAFSAVRRESSAPEEPDLDETSSIAVGPRVSI
ncbi:MAG: sugar transferase [Acidimicrobiia bacterium]